VTALHLPEGLRAEIAAAARAAYPRECCGLIEGARAGDDLHARALHPMRNIAPEADSFAIDPAEHIALQRRLRGSGHAVIGCYHSHPHGRAEPSIRDGGADFVWLIAALDGARHSEIAGFVRRPDGWQRLVIVPDSPGFQQLPASLDRSAHGTL
jgi:desampylase